MGGDRDGNPFVTNEITRQTLETNRAASLARYRARVAELIRTLSIAESTVRVPPGLRDVLAQLLTEVEDPRGIAARNRGELFRQYFVCILAKIDATLAPAPAAICAARGYAGADELIADLLVAEDALIECRAPGLAERWVRPLRREVESFRFCSVRLDCRENSTRTTQALQALWQATAGAGEPPPPDSIDWRSWLIAELSLVRTGVRELAGMPAEAAETLGIFRLIAETRQRSDRDAFGTFILSMTHSAEDLLGVYLLAKEAGLFSDAAAVETCTLPIVPLFETIEDLRAAPTIMRELLGNAMV
jgi:phosphoenolpyruvate carboxylase